jgi:hypothetical protein
MLTKALITFTLITSLFFAILLFFSMSIIYILLNIESLSICGPLSHKHDKDNLMVLEVYQLAQ